MSSIVAFLVSVDSHASVLVFPSPSRLRLMPRGFPYAAPPALGPALPAAGSCYPSASPHLSNGHRRCANFYALSITYAFRPRLRSRLTLGGRALPRKPWIFDGKDSHFTFATHSGILTAVSSTPPYGGASAYCGTLPYHAHLTIRIHSFGIRFQTR